MENLFGAYYRVNLGRPTVLCGRQYENAWSMGEGVTFFLISKDALTDSPDGTHALSFDVSAIDADNLATVPIIGRLLMGYPVDDLLPELLPVVKYLIESDTADGLSGPEIIDRRIAILLPEFIGFAHEEVKMSDLYMETTDEDGVVFGNISRCSLDNL
jgi:hypothetical protein